MKDQVLLSHGYGAYGDPSFDDEILPLVERGFVYAIAHVRGSYLGSDFMGSF